MSRLSRGRKLLRRVRGSSPLRHGISARTKQAGAAERHEYLEFLTRNGANGYVSSLIPILAMSCWWKLPVRGWCITLESCQACSGDLESRMRVRDALQRAVSNRPVLTRWRTHVVRTCGVSDAIFRWCKRKAAGLLDWQRPALVLFGLFAAEMVEPAPWRTVNRKHSEAWGNDHVICAIQGHNYPEVANRPDQTAKGLALDMPLCCRLCSSGFRVLNFSKGISVRYQEATASMSTSSREGTEPSFR